MNEDNLIEEEYETMALEEVAYGTSHALNVLLDILIEKNIISEQEFKDKLDELIEQSPDADDVTLE